MTGQTPTTIGTTPYWNVENVGSGRNFTDSGAGRDVQGPGRRDIMSWLDARLLCVGASTLATTYRISFIELLEDWLCAKLYS